MNCAVVTITGGSSRIKRALTGPAVFVANVGNGCTTAAGTDVVFPDAGEDVAFAGDAGKRADPVGTCNGKSFTGGGATGGGTTGGGTGGDTGTGTGTTGGGGGGTGTGTGGTTVVTGGEIPEATTIREATTILETVTATEPFFRTETTMVAGGVVTRTQTVVTAGVFTRTRTAGGTAATNTPSPSPGIILCRLVVEDGLYPPRALCVFFWKELEGMIDVREEMMLTIYVGFIDNGNAVVVDEGTDGQGCDYWRQQGYICSAGPPTMTPIGNGIAILVISWVGLGFVLGLV